MLGYNSNLDSKISATLDILRKQKSKLYKIELLIKKRALNEI
jgi:hypothetical protein